MSIILIDSGGANIGSIQYAFDRLDIAAELSSDPDTITKASHVILPGVGTAKDAMRKLHDKDGLIDCIKGLTQPVMGICLGMQLLFTHSEEGNVELLGLIEGDVTKFTPQPNLTVPHMGWNTVKKSQSKDQRLLSDISDDAYFYFVHSYAAPEGPSTVAGCEYGANFSAIVAQDNFMGCQFHPERSGKDGAKLLKNFSRL